MSLRRKRSRSFCSGRIHFPAGRIGNSTGAPGTCCMQRCMLSLMREARDIHGALGTTSLPLFCGFMIHMSLWFVSELRFDSVDERWSGLIWVDAGVMRASVGVAAGTAVCSGLLQQLHAWLYKNGTAPNCIAVPQVSAAKVSERLTKPETRAIFAGSLGQGFCTSSLKVPGGEPCPGLLGVVSAHSPPASTCHGRTGSTILAGTNATLCTLPHGQGVRWHAWGYWGGQRTSKLATRGPSVVPSAQGSGKQTHERIRGERGWWWWVYRSCTCDGMGCSLAGAHPPHS